ncbi:MAG: FadR/GntR family transcriptional regulator [Ignavibacteriales bacterium]
MTDFKPIKTKKIYEEIVDQIKDMISSGTFKPGDRLPSEREMSSMLGVSRASVREAVTALQAMGILEVKPGEGTYAAYTQNNDTFEPLAMVLAMENNPLPQLMEVRRILEGEAAALAAVRATDINKRHMTDVLCEMKETAEKHAQGVQFDLQFHHAIAEATHNRVLERIIKTLDNMMHETFLVNRQDMYSMPGKAMRILYEHQMILDAIMAGDSEKARSGMLNHLNHVQSGLTPIPNPS